MPSAFESMPTCTWQAPGKELVPIPLQKIVETVDARISARKRPYRKGAKLDSTGRDQVVWEIEALFQEGSSEPGIPETGNYPENLNILCDSIEVEETGDLTLPTRGTVRAKFKGYRRAEGSDAEDAGLVTLTFWEDTEDGVTAASFSKSTGKATIRGTMLMVRNTFDARGVASADLVDLEALVEQLEDFAAAPFDEIDSAAAQATNVASTVLRMERAFGDAANTANGELALLLTTPESSLAGRTMRELADTAQRLVANVAGIGGTKLISYQRVVSIFDVAAEYGQDAVKLMNMNARIPSHLAIEPRTPIRVFR